MENVELQFKTTATGTYNNTFNTMKKYQEAGLAGRDSKVIFNDIEVPAGYYTTWEESFQLYESLLSGDLNAIESSLPKDITIGELFSIETSIANTYKKLHDKELSSEYLDSLLAHATKTSDIGPSKSI